MRLHALAPGKVNLCLFLGGPRADGRHELVTLFESVSLYDELELTTSTGGGHDEVICPGVAEPNLVTRALRGLRAIGWSAPPVRIEIRKRVPVAAGMAGGSADAAAMLRLAPQLAPVPADRIAALAAQLGADVPSQLQPGLALGTGAGEIVQPLAPLAPHALLILPQAGQLATAEVYREADRLGLPRIASELSARCRELVSGLDSGSELPARMVVNDLEPAAVSLCPQIEDALEHARRSGADHAIVCGSGPTVAGLYWGTEALARATTGAQALGARFAGAVAVGPVGGAIAAPQPA